jgi:hypothetical protein
VENGNKKNSVLTSLWVWQSSSVLGAKLAALKTFYGWEARVAIVCIHVHPGIVIRRKVSADPREESAAIVLACRSALPHDRPVNVPFIVRATKIMEVDVDVTAGEGKNASITGNTRWARPSARSAQIKGAVRVHQESLIR